MTILISVIQAQKKANPKIIFLLFMKENDDPGFTFVLQLGPVAVMLLSLPFPVVSFSVSTLVSPINVVFCVWVFRVERILNLNTFYDIFDHVRFQYKFRINLDFCTWIRFCGSRYQNFVLAILKFRTHFMLFFIMYHFNLCVL